jgi:hypothetical protein
MSSPLEWQCLSVADFLELANWQGLKTPPTPLTAKTKPATIPRQPPTWDFSSPQTLCLSVGQFFGLTDWEEVSSNPATADLKPEFEWEFSLTLPVEQFFSFMVWDGKPKLTAEAKDLSVAPAVSAIEVKPKLESSLPPLEKGDEDLKVDSLSSLF